MAQRIPTRPSLTQGAREQILHDVVCNGPKWEASSGKYLDVFVSAVRAKYLKKRLGTQKVKEPELLEATGQILSDSQSTAFMALAARVNYLSPNKHDISYSAKGRCRTFARPCAKGGEALKKCVRYVVHAPRLVYHVAFEDCDGDLRVHTDTHVA